MKRLIVLIGVVGISASAVLVRWSTAPSMVLVLYRMLIATAMMGVPTALRGREELRGMTKKELLLTMAAGCCLGLHFSAFFESLRHTSIAAAVILSDAEVLFVAHHGSKYSTSEEFLKEVMPEIGIISVGENGYGHPSMEAMASR